MRAGEGGQFLDSGDKLPSLQFPTVSDGEVSVPAWFGERWGVLLIYRAHW